jgi:uncharacterized OB-fold protein
MSEIDGIAVPDTDYPPLKPYFEAARAHEFRLPRCSACDTFNWYPHDACAACGGTDFTWTKMSGRGRLFSWAVVRRALHPPLAVFEPYVSAVIEIEEDPKVRIVTRLLDADSESLEIGQPVRVRFEDFGYPVAATGVTGVFWSVAPP